MDSLTLLTTRRSTKNLTAPAPDELQTEIMLQAATQVPDHGSLQPWRFIVINSESGMQRFRTLLNDTAAALNMGEQTIEKAKRVGNMAPMVVGVIASPKPGKPEWEQHMSAGCAAYAVQLAAKAQGFDSVWLSGLWINTEQLRGAFECGEKEKIIALLMVGTAQTLPDQPKNIDTETFTRFW